MSKKGKMLSGLETRPSLPQRLGLGEKESSAAPVLRAVLALVKEAPGVGWVFKGTAEALNELSGISDDAELEARLDELLAVGRQSNEQLGVLGDIVRAIFTRQEWLVEQLRASGMLVAPERLTAFAKEAALAEYRGRVANELRYADQRGVEGAARAAHVASLPFDDVYVVPRLVPERERMPAHEREKDLLRRLLDEMDSGADQRVRLEEEYALLTGERWRLGGKEPDAGLALGEALKGARQAVVIGSPGVGKSTLSRFLARAAALGEEGMRERLDWGEDVVPVLVPLAAFAEARRTDCDLPLRDFIDAAMEKRGGAALVEAMGEALEDGRALVLLDGVDEVPESGARAAVVQAVDAFLTDHAEARVVVTSRPYGYIRLRGELPHFTLPNFTAEQVEEFVHKWQRACEIKQHPEAPDFDRAKAEADALLQEIRRNPKVTELATNPLMLVIVSFIRYEKARLPEERVQLYSAAVNTLMDTWNHWRSQLGRDAGGATLPLDRLVRVWGAVAEWTRRTRNTGVVHRAELKRKLVEILREREYDDEDPEATAEAYLRAAADRAGLLEERGPDIFAFWHPTFEEFLAAVELATPTSKAADKLLQVADDPRWREVIILAVGYIGIVQRDPETASEVVEALLTRSVPATEPIIHGRLRLAAACILSRQAVRRTCVTDVLLRFCQALDGYRCPDLERAFVEMSVGFGSFRVPAEAVPVLDSMTRYPNWDVGEQCMRLIGEIADESTVAREICERVVKSSRFGPISAAIIGLANAGRLDDLVLDALSSTFFLRNLGPPVRAVVQKLRDRLLERFAEGSIRAAGILLLKAGQADAGVLSGLRTRLDTESPDALEIAHELHWAGKTDERVIEYLKRDVVASPKPSYTSAIMLHELGVLEGEPLDAVRGWFLSDDAVVWSGAMTFLMYSGYDPLFHEVLLASLERTDHNTRLFRAAHYLAQDESARETVLDRLRALSRSDDEYVCFRAAVLLLELEAGDPDARVTLRRFVREGSMANAFEAARELWRVGEYDLEIAGALRSVFLGPNYPLKVDSLDALRNDIQQNERMIRLAYEWALEEDLPEIRNFTDLLLDYAHADLAIAERVARVHPEPEVAVSVCRRVMEPLPLTHEEGKRIAELVQHRNTDKKHHPWARTWLHRWFWQQLETRPATA